MLAQTQHLGKIMRADFHRGFADFERGFAHRVGAPFQHGDCQRGIALAQLQRQTQAGQATTGDHDICALCIHGEWLLLVTDETVANSPSASSISTGLARTRRYSRQICP